MSKTARTSRTLAASAAVLALTGWAHDAFADGTPATLVSHWTFDESSGSVAHDRTGTFDGTLSGGAAFVPGGISGNAISLAEATNSLVNMGNRFPNFQTGDFSIVAWVRTTSADLGTFPLAKHESGSFNGYFLALNVGGSINDYGSPGKAFFYASSPPGTEALSTSDVTDGAWHQVVGVAAAGKYRIYVDGAPLEAERPIPSRTANSAPFLIGGISSGGPVATYTGLVDEVQVYSGALQDAEIDLLFANPGRDLSTPTGLVAHWTFDERIGTTAHDSVNGLDGTLSGGAAFVTGGISGNAVVIDRAQNGLVNMGDVLALNGGDFTVSAWIRTTSIEPDSLFVSKHESTFVSGYFLNVNATGGGGAANRVTFYASDAAVAQSPTSTTTINDGTWHHVVGVYRSGLTHGIYVDGVPAESSTASQAIVDRGAPFLVGGVKENGNPTSRYTGLVDDVQVYARALSDGEIARLFAHPGRALFDQDRYDLVADWSEDFNPNGVWSLREGGNLLPHVAEWASASGGPPGQPAWAPTAFGNTFLPGWFRTNGDVGFATDWLPGDVFVHSTDDSNGLGKGVASVVWTSLHAGTVNVSGGVWAGREIGRSNDWRLSLNGVLVTQGSVASGDAFSRARPFLFAGGSGGASAVRGIQVRAGDEIALEIVRTSSAGDLVGVDLQVAYVTTATVAGSGDVAPGASGGRFASFGPPSIHRLGGVAFRGTLAAGAGGVTKLNDAGVWADLGSGSPTLIAREGSPAPGTSGTFASFGEPAYAGPGRVAFVGFLKPGAGATKKNAAGIWATTNGGQVALVARAGSVAPGAGSATFSQFLTIAMPDAGGPVFLASLKGATAATDLGVWAVDASGALRLVVREGDQVSPGGGGPRIVSSLRPAPSADANRRRGFGGVQSAAFRVTFVDRTQAVLAFPLGATQPTVSAIGPASWLAPDAQLGLAGAAVEDFEDTTLVSGLSVQLSGGSNDYGPATTLPRTIDPAADDPNSQKVLVPGIWDGARVLMNRQTPVPAGYVDPEWADLTFRTPIGASSIGFSLEQLEVAGTPLTVVTDRGSFGFVLTATPNLVLADQTGQRNGYVRIDAGAGERILSVKIDNQSGDGFAIDHVLLRDAIPLPARTSVAVAGGTGPGAFRSFGSPGIDGLGRVAFVGTLAPDVSVDRTNDTGVWAEDAAALQLVARKGNQAPGTNANFASFGDPVAGEGRGVAFTATVVGSGATGANRTGIWTNAGVPLTLVARQGDAAPGGGTLEKFGALSVTPDGRVVFLATLSGVPKASAVALFVGDGAPLERLIAAGSPLTLDGVTRTVSKIQYAPRSGDAPGVVTVAVTFSDKTQAIVRFVR